MPCNTAAASESHQLLEQIVFFFFSLPASFFLVRRFPNHLLHLECKCAELYLEYIACCLWCKEFPPCNIKYINWICIQPLLDFLHLKTQPLLREIKWKKAAVQIGFGNVLEVLSPTADNHLHHSAFMSQSILLSSITQDNHSPCHAMEVAWGVKSKWKKFIKKEECKVYIKCFNVKQEHLCCIPGKLLHFMIQKKIKENV